MLVSVMPITAQFHPSPRRRFLCRLFAVAAAGLFASASPANTFFGPKNMAVTVQPIATEAAINAFNKGGNAVDAAVAAALTLGVVDGHNSGIGGGCFLLIRFPDGRVAAIDGREMAPAAATRDLYVRNGKADPTLSQTGALASGVPGALAAYGYASKTFGKLPLSEHLLAAADVAELGFQIDSVYARKLSSVATTLAQFPASRKAFLKRDGTPYAVKETLRQPDLARSYRAIAKDGLRWFYAGPFSQATARWMESNGGILTEQDFLSYKLEQREPVRSTYRGFDVVGFPPPSSGGVHVAQILNMLETRDLRRMRFGTVDTIHFTAEAMKLAFADRAHWLGDPAFAKVPLNLTSKDYARELAAKIDLQRASTVEAHGWPARAHDEIFGSHTTHICTADAAGYWVSLTATINTAFGSKVVIPGTGIVLNNQMDDFSIQPGVRNAFGLVGAEANAIAPGKRPLSSMSPTIVTKDNEPIVAIGGAGGPTIISQTVLALVNMADFRADPEFAIGTPRYHHQWSPDELRVEADLNPKVVGELEARGHRVVRTAPFGVSNMIMRSRDGTQFVGVNDPRVPGMAKGVE